MVSVASQASPAPPAARQPLAVRDGAERRDDEVGVDARSVGELDPRRAQGLHADAETQVDAVRPVHVRAAARRARARAAPSGTARCRSTVTSRPCLRAVAATSQPMNPPPTIATRGRSRQRGLQRERVVEAAERVDALGAGPLPGAAAGGHDQRGRTAPRRRRPAARRVRARSSPVAATPRRHSASNLRREGAVVGRLRAGQQLLRQRRARVRQVLLVPHDDELARRTPRRAPPGRRAVRPATLRRRPAAALALHADRHHRAGVDRGLDGLAPLLGDVLPSRRGRRRRRARTRRAPA